MKKGDDDIMIVMRNSKVRVENPGEVATVLQGLLATEDAIDQAKEHFYGIHLDARNSINLIEVVSVGTLNASLVHPREVFRRAIGEGTAALLVAHNHPSGDHTPSDEDLIVTRKLVEAGTLLGIQVLDHIIFSSDGFTSIKRGHMM